jgi:dynein heavy chain
LHQDSVNTQTAETINNRERDIMSDNEGDQSPRGYGDGSEYDMNDIEEMLDFHEEHDYSLSKLKLLIEYVFFPLLSTDKGRTVKDTKANSSDTAGGQATNIPLSIDFINNFKKFNHHITDMIKQLSGDVTIEIPDVNIYDVKAAAEDEQIVVQLENALNHWTQSIRGLLETVANKERDGEGPLSEIEYWRTRQAMLGTIWEQLNDKNVKKMIEVMRVYDAQLLPGFDDQFQELTKLYMEAKDNVKFLTTLERHFKNISNARGSLLPISDTLPTMMTAIRLVWVVSRHYNTDKRMNPLMELIANEICDKVAQFIDVEEAITIMFDNPEPVMRKLKEGAETLRKWKTTYYQIRDRIEQERRDDRWEFDKDRMFERSEYMTDRCMDLYEFAKVVSDYKKYLGPELRNVTGESSGIDDVLNRVQNLLRPLQNLGYDVFDKKQMRQWNEVMKEFRENVEYNRKRTNTFIDKSFKKLRSSELAFKLLRDVKSINTEKDSINQKMALKNVDILKRYGEEIDAIYAIFKSEKAEPPKTKNLPPVAGAIYWSDSLFQRIKKPMVLFQTSSGMLSTEKGKEIKEKSYQYAKAIKDFEEKEFKDWAADISVRANAYLKESILGREKPKDSKNELEIPRSFVNFHPELLLLMQETKYLNKLGKQVPEIALNVTLQEEKYHGYIENLKIMLNSFHSSIAILEEAEFKVLLPRIRKLRKALEPGFTVLNWNSLGIDGFIRKCNTDISDFQSTVKKVQKNAALIKGLVRQMRDTPLIKEPHLQPDQLVSLEELYEILDNYKNQQVQILQKKYKTISQTLLKIEGDLIQSGVITDRTEVTGRHELLQGYYMFWEEQIFRALRKMVVSSIKILKDFLGIHLGKEKRHKTERRKAPIFKVTAALIHTSIVISPDLDKVREMINRIVQNIVEGTKDIIRWYRSTCIEVSDIDMKTATTVDQQQQQKENQDKQTIIRNTFSYYQEISQMPQVKNVEKLVDRGITNTLDSVGKYIKKYSQFDVYWKLPKEMAIEKFASKQPKWEQYDSKFEEYSKLLKDLQPHMAKHKTYDFILLDYHSLVRSIEQEAKNWIAALGKLLNDNIRPKLTKVNEQIDNLSTELHQEIETIDDLRKILRTIDDARTRSVNIERDCREIEDVYYTLQIYSVEVVPEETELANRLSQKWTDLLQEAAVIDKKLIPQKASFTKETQKRVEDFQREVRTLKEKFREGPGNPNIQLEKGLVLIEILKEKLEEMRNQRDYLVLSEKLFNLPISTFPDLTELESEMASIGKIFEVFGDWQKNTHKWSQTLWSEIPLEEMKKKTAEFSVTLIDKRQFASDLQQMPAHKAVVEKVKAFKDSIPLFTYLKSDALRTRHWEALMQETGVNLDLNPNSFTLKNLIELNLYKFNDQIAEIYSGARKELKIEQLFKDIREHWRGQKFQMKKHLRDNVDRGYILTSIEEIKELLDEDTTALSGISGSRYVIPFLNDLNTWETQLTTIGEVIDLWMEVQRSWMYLEIIFIGSEDIREQLAKQAEAFDKIDEDWAKIMNETFKKRNVLEACLHDGRLTLLRSLERRLNECQKGLANYLETKRDAFPRFFFISDDELLEILGSSNIMSVQKYMQNMFENCEELVFKENTNIILGMASKEGESFLFNTPVIAENAVEKWLNNVKDEMRRTLKTKTKHGLFHYPKKQRVQWIKDNLAMVSLVSSQIWWTWEVEDAFRRVKKGEKMAVKFLAQKLTKQLNSLVDEVRTPLDPVNQIKLRTMIIIDVHARDIVDNLVRDSILDEREFEWESQLRFYWDKQHDDIRIRQCTGEFEYGYEYMGLNGRLVITPLTDRCFMTLTQALTFNLGGSPSGPAGTGKTESVKDLAKSMAIMCVVFNCGDGLGYQAMHTIFSGLCQTGAWGCFDEFNRIELPVLSVVSTQIRDIQNALKARVTRFRFDESDINLDAKTGIFITMNPGYAGRVELPDNLKALFRPCVMVVPDMETICEIMLLSEGFNSARLLARKMTKLYSLAKGQLSKQNHYDWSLRALKAILVMAGRLKREDSKKNEDELLMRAIHDMNAPKFVFEDTPLFADLLNDLFVNVSYEKVTYPALYKAVEDDLRKNNYHVDDDAMQVHKVIELYETMATRHSVMVVGGTCGGKSVVIQTLVNAQQALKLPTKLYVVNPKAQSTAELYGVLDKDTRDWTDGILSHSFREMNKKAEKGEERRYILFDGDVDAHWIENMNSVMDDNKILTLPNNERITLNTPQCALLFEVGDLRYASPATVSRCGMVYVDPKNLGYDPYVRRWLNTNGFSQERIDVLDRMFEKYLLRCINFVLKGQESDGRLSKKLKTCVPMTPLTLTKQLCIIMQCIFGDKSQDTTDEREVECLYLYATVWSIGGCLVDSDRARFDEYLKKASKWTLVDNGESLQDKFVPAGCLPSRLTLYEYFYDMKYHQWKPWIAEVSAFVKPADGKFANIMVPTIDTVRYTHMLRSLLQIQEPVLFVGDSGTAKTVIIQNCLKSIVAEKPEAFNNLFINFSSRTSSLDTQRTIEDNLEKKIDTYAPFNGKRLNIFVDELNMPIVDEYGTQQPIALLKALFEMKGFYERGRKSLDFKKVKDLQFIAAMAPPGGGRNSVDPRFLSKFNIFNISFPSDASLTKIYSTILEDHLLNFDDNVQAAGQKITELTLKLYSAVVQKLPPTPSKFHYVFNLRDLSRVYEGLCLATIDRFNTGEKLVRLWRNECMRVFYDRLITLEDKEFVTNSIADLLRQGFPNFADTALQDPLLFGDFLDMHEVDSLRLYEDMYSYEKIKPVIEHTLNMYNQGSTDKQMNLVMFEDALEHLTRIHRIIRMNRGHALLVGVGGSGKQSLTRLAAYTAGYDVFEITLTRVYGDNQFREDLKELYRKLGVENKKMVFLFTDAHVTDRGFLEYINNMLTSGMVPALFADDEKDQAVQAVMKEVKESGITETKENCWNFFVNKCRDNLHVVLAMSPAGDNLRIRCRDFPGLVNNTTIDWFTPWPAQALEEVGSRFLEHEDLPEEMKPLIVQHMVKVHLSVNDFSKEFLDKLRRYNYVTPKNYLDYVFMYKKLLEDNRKRIDELRAKLEGGLEQLREGKEQVEAMSHNLKEAKIIVQTNTIENNKLMKLIGVNTAEAFKQKQIAEQQDTEITIEFEKLTVEQARIEEELERAEPELRKAEEGLDALNPADIAQVKTYTSPTEHVRDVGACLVILLSKGNVEPNWATARSLMSDPYLIKNLKTFDKTKLTQAKMSKISQIFKKHGKDFTYEQLKLKSAPAAGLLVWIDAMRIYYKTLKTVEPIRREAEKAERTITQKKDQLHELKSTLSKLEDEIGSLKTQLEQRETQAHKLKEEATTMENKLNAANKLIDGLGSERIRWAKQIDTLLNERNCLIGDCLLAASFLSYTGTFTVDFRERMVDKLWLDDIISKALPVSENFDIENILTTDVQKSQWAYEGLPSDKISVQNGILTTYASRFPLCIDPQLQAVKWIKNKEKDLIVRTFDDDDFLKQLEKAVKFGQPFLLENLDEYVDSVIDPILAMPVFGKNRVIKLGDEEMDVDDNFRMYLCTKLSNPHYSPEVSGKTTIVNYTVTDQGLREQLLNAVVNHDRPDLENQRKDLVYTMSENKTLLQRLEDKILHELYANRDAAIKVPLIENVDLIRTLDETKNKVTEINNKLVQAEQNKKENTKARDAYKPVAKRGSILYFVMSSLSQINSMYEYSLASYTDDVFKTSLERSDESKVLDGRLENIIEYLTKATYTYTCTGLFESDKLSFSLQMCLKIMEGDKKIVAEELDFFLKGNISLGSDSGTQQAKPFDWLSEQNWKNLLKLQTLNPEFETILEDILDNEGTWKEWYDLEMPESGALPMGYSDKLTAFQYLCLLKCFRVDRIVRAVTRFITNQMRGDHFVKSPVLEYKPIFEQSTEFSPIVCMISPGYDPANEIIKLADSEQKRIKYISLGDGQDEKARVLLEKGIQKGYWVLLQNCHLLVKWMKDLEKILDKQSKDKVNAEFRLWLTTEVTPDFPLGILQRSLKVVTEPPNSLQLNMKTTYASITDDMLNQCSHEAFRPLVYVLSFFHAVIQERRKYGKIGWNVPYDFNRSDFDVSFSLMATYLNKAKLYEDPVPWDSLKYLVGEAMYGGRVTDQFDRRVLTTYLNEYMGDFLFDSFQPFHFYVHGSIDYKLPPLHDIDATLMNQQAYIQYIEKNIELENSPEVFGLHANAEIGYNTISSENLWVNLIKLQMGSGSSGSGGSREDYITKLANDILSLIPEPFNRLALQEQKSKPTPVDVVLLQEVERWNNLLAVMKSSLVNLKRALIGEIGMSNKLEDVSLALLKGVLPAMWSEMVPETKLNLANWLNHFQRRYDQYSRWISTGSDPVVMWLSGLHIPESYLTALIQMTCKRYKWPLDRTTLFSRVTQYTNPDEVTEKPVDGCYVQGLLLEGASWDTERSCLTKQKPKILVEELPIIEVTPVENSKLRLQNTFRSPVYVTSDRNSSGGSSVVFEADLASEEHWSHWILQGVAVRLS